MKISNFWLREFANRMIAENGFFEVMLANRKDCITEAADPICSSLRTALW